MNSDGTNYIYNASYSCFAILISVFLVCPGSILAKTFQQENTQNSSPTFANRLVRYTSQEDNGINPRLLKKVTVNYDQMSLKTILFDLAERGGFELTYANQQVPLDKTMSINIESKPIYSVLASILKGTGLGFSVSSNNHLIISKKSIRSISVETITGTVTQASNEEPLPGVNIVVKGTTTGTTTEGDGTYSLDVTSLQDTLVFSYIGFERQEIPIQGRSEINVEMVLANHQMADITVMGYKTVEDRDISASVSSIDTEELQDIPSASLLDKLSGKAPGLQAVQRSGLPGGSSGGLVIRGNTSLSASSDVSGLSNPLYIVDGVPMSLEDFAGYSVTQNDFFATLDPKNIKSIDVLKDAAATAVYGSRGANGVVIIETKDGTSGDTRISASTAFGVNFEPEKLDVYIGEAERQEKVRLYKQSLTNLFGEQAWVDVRNGLEVEGYLYPPVLTNSNNPAYNNAYDYQDLFYQEGFNQQYNLSMEGGNQNNSFRVGLGYYDEKGILAGINFNRYTINASLNSDVSSNIHNDLSVRLVHTNRVGGQSDHLRTFPTSPTQLPSSLYYRTEDELDLLSGKLGDTHQSNKSYLATISEALRLTLAQGLTLDNHASLSANFGKREYFVPSTASDNRLSNVESNNSENITVNLNSVLSYLKEVGDHEFTGLAGVEANMDRRSVTNLSAQDGPSNQLQVVQGYQDEDILGYSDRVKSNLFSYFANLSYKYKDRYKIEGVVRRDGSSRFGANNKWATFPSVQTHWIFTDEPWMESVRDVLSFGKVRVSYGKSGQIASNPLLQYNSFVATSNIGTGFNDIYNNRMDTKTYGGQRVLVPDFDQIANRSLSWTKSTEVNYGLDLHLFDERVYLKTDFYSRSIEGQVFTSQLAPYMGYNSIRSNLVDMISNGWEVGLTTYMFPRGNDFQWDMTFNFARNKTVVSNLGNGGRDYIGGNYAFIENQPAFQYYMPEYLGTLDDRSGLPVNPLTGEPIQYYGADAGLALNQQGEIFPGMPLFTDVNGDYLIDGASYGNDEKVIQGKSPQPDVYGGFNTNVQYKNLKLRVQTSFAFGHHIFNTNLQSMLSQYDDNVAFFTNALYKFSDDIDFWEEPGDDSYYPMRYITYADGGSARSFRESSMFLEKGDYWSIDNVTLSYNLPRDLTQRIGFRDLNVYATVRNLYMWKKSNVPDPRLVTKTGYYNGQGYPISRNVTLGMNINF